MSLLLDKYFDEVVVDRCVDTECLKRLESFIESTGGELGSIAVVAFVQQAVLNHVSGVVWD